MEQNETYYISWNLITAYFGDGLNGKTEEEVIKEALQNLNPEYITQIEKNMSSLLADTNIKKKDFLLKCNVYCSTEDTAEAMLKKLIANIKK